MHDILDDVAAWWQAGARAHVVARVRVARGASDDERAALNTACASLEASAAQRSDVPPFRGMPAMRQLVFCAPDSGHVYTLDFVARGSATAPYPCSRIFTLFPFSP